MHPALLQPTLLCRSGIPKTGLVALYLFNEKSGQILIDHSGNNNHSTLGSTSGADTNDPSVVLEGRYFTTDDYCSCSGSSPAFSLSQYTIIAVAKPTNADVAGILISKNTSNTSGAGKTGFVFYQSSSGSGTWTLIQFDTSGDIHPVSTGSGSVTAGEWVMVTGICNSTEVYISKNAGTLIPGGTPFTAAPNIVQDCVIGKYAYTGAVYFDGSIAFIAVWNRALSQAEITQCYTYLKGYLKANRGIAI